MYSKSEYHNRHYEWQDKGEYRTSVMLLEQFAPIGSRVLDFGCGIGDFLITLKAAAYLPYGVEFDEGASTRAHERAGCPAVSTKYFLSQPAQPDFDVIHLGDVLEHLGNPRETLATLITHLKPNGLFYVEGPIEVNPSPVYWCAKLYGYFKMLVQPDHIAQHPPTHLFRTDGRQQLYFFEQEAFQLEVLHWEIYETGWPYSEGGIVKKAISYLATILGGKRFLGSVLGNRFRTILRYRGAPGSKSIS